MGGWIGHARTWLYNAFLRFLKWFGFGVLVAAIPFAFAWWARSHHGHDRIDWFELWPHGELALVSVALAADGLSEVAFGKKRGVIKGFAAAVCVLAIVGGVYLYAEAQALPLSKTADIKDDAAASVYIALLAIVSAGVCKVLAED